MKSDFLVRYGNTALVAGASEGLGAAFAQELGRLGFDLILVARRLDVLESLRKDIRKTFDVKINLICCDLASPDALDRIRNEVAGRDINLMIYNAVSPYIGPFLECSHEQRNQMNFVNLITPQQLTFHFGEEMVKKGRGGIVLMSSLAGFQGSGFLSAYAAAKAFMRVFAEGLWYEWREKGVDIMACCAGATSTPNYINSKPRPLGLFNPQIQSPKEVVLECFEKLGRRPSIVTGRWNRIASFFMNRIFSRQRAVMTMGDATRKMYDIPN